MSIMVVTANGKPYLTDTPEIFKLNDMHGANKYNDDRGGEPGRYFAANKDECSEPNLLAGRISVDNYTKWCFTVWENWRKKRNSGPRNYDDEFVQVPDDIFGLANKELNY